MMVQAPAAFLDGKAGEANFAVMKG